MKTISMLAFRKKASEVLAAVRKGQRIVLTYRGKPVARLEPIFEQGPLEDDPFYDLGSLATSEGGPLTNEDMDRIVYGL